MNYMKLKDSLIRQTRDYFKDYGAAKAVVGISGGKDSTVCAKLMVDALGADNVYALHMPNSNLQLNQPFDSYSRENFGGTMCRVVETTELKHVWLCPIANECGDFLEGIPKFPSEQARINMQPRIRMTKLYMLAQTIGDAFVVNTSNLDERYVGYSTIWGDSVGDFAPLQELHVSEVIELGRALGLPEDLLTIPPSDGLSGMTDEEKLGFSYREVEEFVESLRPLWKGAPSRESIVSVIDKVDEGNMGAFIKMEEPRLKIWTAHKRNLFKWKSVRLAGCVKEEL